MKRNLTDAEMVAEAAAAGEAVNLDRVAEVRRIVRLTLDDERATRSEAEMRAGLYRELLNYPRSEELSQRVATRLTQLQQLDPTVKLTPLGDVRLGFQRCATIRKASAGVPGLLPGPQPLTPVMNAAGLSAADWFRQMLMKGPTRAARGTRSAAQGPRLGRRSTTKISYTAPRALAARYRLSDDLTDN
jgi:hypothetical protein